MLCLWHVQGCWLQTGIPCCSQPQKCLFIGLMCWSVCHSDKCSAQRRSKNFAALSQRCSHQRLAPRPTQHILGSSPRWHVFHLQQLGWLADELETKQLGCPKTVVFATSINTVSEIYSWLMYQLKEKAYVSNTIHPKDSIVSMFHGHISPALQQHILEQFRNSTSTIRPLVCTIAFGMGIEVKDIKRVVHWGKVQSILAYWQEVGRCGRDGLPAQAIWYPTSVAGQDHEVLKKMRDNQQCIRKTMLQAFKITDSEEQEELSNCQLDSCVQRSCHLCSCCRETCQCGVLEEWLQYCKNSLSKFIW